MVHLVLDTLNVHRKASLYQTFPAAGISLHPQARELTQYVGYRVQRFFRSCLGQSFPNEETFCCEVQA